MNKAYIVTKNSVSIIYGGENFIAQITHKSYKEILDALGKEDYETAIKLINLPKQITSFTEGLVEIKNRTIYYNNEPVHNVVCERILNFISENKPHQALINFLTKLLQNPSKHSVDQLYSFLEHKNLPITKDGCFLAYKGVNSDYTDIYTGRINNKPGAKIPPFRRNQVDDNPKNHCSYGYHVGSLEYATSFGAGGRVIIVKVDPANVVSVPEDYQCQKCRVVAYEPICDYTGPLPSTYYQEDDDAYDE